MANYVLAIYKTHDDITGMLKAGLPDAVLQLLGISGNTIWFCTK